MPGTLTKFRIEQLHARRTIDVEIQDNKLVLVGENGTGKSTVANFIYFFLTRQWRRMVNYEFKSITAVIDGQEVELTRDAIKAYRGKSSIDRYFRRLTLSAITRIQNVIQALSVDDVFQNSELAKLSEIYSIPFSVLVDYAMTFRADELPETTKLEEVTDVLQSALRDQVLYLPTYRRIEQELQSIFPNLELDKTRLIQDRLRKRSRDSHYIELVEFGMEDVQETIKHKMSEIKEDVRNGLSTLTATYLRDVIRGTYKDADFSMIKELSDATINTIFSRIDEQILPRQEQERLREIVARINRGEALDESDKVVVHFLTQLIELYRAQQEREKDVINFVRVCNVYLRDKRLVYDNLKFDICIEQTETDLVDNSATRDTIDLKMLSSGEKQIVSLFSHIYLSGSTGYFVIIDEPELSLSVPWQRRFLPDILATGKCNGLIAVTHSPFIFDNELDAYTHSLEEFIRVAVEK